MKRDKKLFILLGILVICVIATVIVTKVEDRKEEIRTSEEVILAVPADTVTSLSWEYGTMKLSFTKGETWKWSEDDAFPVDGETISTLLATFEELTAAFAIDDVDDFSQYGLEDPNCTINFATADQEYQVLLGAYSTMDSQRYLSIGDGSVYLVKEDPYDLFAVQIADLIDQDEIPAFASVKSLTVSGDDNYAAAYSETNTVTCCDTDKYFVQKDGKTAALDSTKVEDYASALSLMNLKDYVSYNVTADELAAWGLDTPALTVTIDYTQKDENGNETEGQFTMSLGQNQEELAAKAAADAKGEEYTGTVTGYVRIGESPIVYKLSDADYNKLCAVTFNDLRHASVLTADFGTVTGIDFVLDGETYSITASAGEEKSEEEDTTVPFLFGETEVDATGLKTAITALTISEFREETPAEKQEIALTFHLNNASFPEATVEIYRYDGSSCLVVLDGECLGLADRTAVVDLIESVNAIVLG